MKTDEPRGRRPLCGLLTDRAASPRRPLAGSATSPAPGRHRPTAAPHRIRDAESKRLRPGAALGWGSAVLRWGCGEFRGSWKTKAMDSKEEPEAPQQCILTFHNPKVSKVKGDRRYQQATLPTNTHPSAVMAPEKRQQLVDQTQTYVRMLSGSLCGFSFLVLVCVSPMNWVLFLVTSEGLELHSGLWVSCSHKLCWMHMPEILYYLHLSRLFFIFSMVTIIIYFILLLSSCLPRRGFVISSLDLKLSLLSLTSALWLLVCLILFLQQAREHSEGTMESQFLWPYHGSWCADFLYTFAGLMSFLNHRDTSTPPLDHKAFVIPTEQTRLGVGPVPEEPPVQEEMVNVEVEASDRKRQNNDKAKLAKTTAKINKSAFRLSQKPLIRKKSLK
ncbi:transmembrane protein 202 isoform X2 [Erinaceus europaeus]|uniref:Transmembrane protein 202 isoform X2 n=1 Tax=Erinaceus europaeus TaxID=9365 RepID=A0A1S3WUK9_ERIEU|nr:transmembrane protein 202 isoform X2 [Erinaceus europaeus]